MKKEHCTDIEIKKAREALVSVCVNLFYDRLTYGDNVEYFEEKMEALLKEYDKIIHDYRSSDVDIIKDNC